MRILVFPEQIEFHSQRPNARITVSRLLRFDPNEGFVRVTQLVWFVPNLKKHQCRLNQGIYEIRTDEGNEFIILLPQRIGLSVDVTRELLQNPIGIPQPAQIPYPLARAMTDLIGNGLSWAEASRLILPGPNAEAPSEPLGSPTQDKDNQP